MSGLAPHLKARPRLYLAGATGLAVAWLLPPLQHWTARVLVGWDVAVWLYLLLIFVMMARADHHRLRRNAVLQAQGELTVLCIVVAAALASLVAIVVELAAAKSGTSGAAWPHLVLAAATVVGSWLLLPVLFALSYASLYYRSEPPGGLAFPDADPAFRPDYSDFLYFSFTIAVASQTADVAVATRPLRRLVLLQSLLAFTFNAAILALTINIAAGLF